MESKRKILLSVREKRSQLSVSLVRCTVDFLRAAMESRGIKKICIFLNSRLQGLNPWKFSFRRALKKSKHCCCALEAEGSSRGAYQDGPNPF